MTDDDLEVRCGAGVGKFGRLFLFAGSLPASAAGHPDPAEVHGGLPPALLARMQPNLAREIPGGEFDSHQFPSISIPSPTTSETRASLSA